MKAHYLTAKEKRIMGIALDKANEQAEDIGKRAGYIFCIAMHHAGLSSKTINKVLKLVPNVTEIYSDMRTDELADFAFCSKLQEQGIDVEMTESEL